MRFYRKEHPEVGDCVMVNVIRIAETGVYVTLLEYNALPGFIPLVEVGRRRRILSLNRHFRVNRREVVKVIRIDREHDGDIYLI